MLAVTRQSRTVLLAVAAFAVGLAACGSSTHRAAPPAPPSGPSAPPKPTVPTPSSSAPDAPSPPAAWSTYDHDARRSGVDPSSSSFASLRVAWTSPSLDGAVYAQPLVVGTTVVVATEDDSVYAFDTATGALKWKRHLATPVTGSQLPCGNISPSGITGTPVIDTRSGLIWAVTFSSPFVHTLWGLRLGDGTVTSSRNADPPGADPRAEQERGALALYGSTVYIPYGGLYGDCSDYHGWLVGMSTANPASTAKTTWESPAARAGIWAPPGVVVDGANLFVATGNGTPVNQIGGSESVLRLSPALAVEDSFTPTDYARLSAGDQDLDSTSPAVLPGALMFQIGKEGVGYLLDPSHLGGLGGSRTSIQVCDGGFGGTAVDGDVVLLSCFDGLYAVKVTAPAGLSVLWSASGLRPGPPIVAGGDVWTVDRRSGQLLGLALATGQVVARQPVSVAGTFPSPASAGGRLFVPDGSRLLVLGGA